MNDLLVQINEGLQNYEALSDDNKAIAEITFNKVTGVLAADINADYSDNDITALIQAVNAVGAVAEAVEKKATFIAFKHYYPTLKEQGAVQVGEKKATNLQTLAKLCGVRNSPKQRGSSYKAILESPLDLDLFKDCTIGRLSKFAEAISKGVSVEDISPDTTPEQLADMIKKLNTIDTTEGTENGAEGAENGAEGVENGAEGAENSAETGTEGAESTPRGVIQIDPKNLCIRITNATPEDLIAFFEKISGERSPAKHITGVLEYTKM